MTAQECVGVAQPSLDATPCAAAQKRLTAQECVAAQKHLTAPSRAEVLLMLAGVTKTLRAVTLQFSLVLVPIS